MIKRATPPSRRRGIHAAVVDAVGLRIVTGQQAEGSIIDLEALETEFAVSRTALRESIKVLAAKHLVDARPKRGTYVLPRSEWNLLDSDVMAWRGDDRRLRRELEEVRLALEPVAARHAAARRSDEDLGRLRSAFQEMADCADAAATSPAAVAGVTDADLLFHKVLGESSGNELLSQLEKLLTPALRARHHHVFKDSIRNRDFLHEHRAVLDAISDQDPGAAEERMRVLLQHAAEDSESH